MSNLPTLTEPEEFGQGGPSAGGLEIRNLHKSYGAVSVLRGMDLSASAGEIHALLGENGAGKSTLMKVLSGVVAKDEGSMSLDGAELHLGTPKAATNAGIRTVFQELSSVAHLSVAENLMYGHEPSTMGIIRRRRLEAEASAIMARTGLSRIDVQVKASDLSLGDRQLLEVAKALREPAKVLVLDEATSALSTQDSDWVMKRAREAAGAGAAVLLITHRLAEARENADRFTVMRSGINVLSGAPSSYTDDELITAMLGRRIDTLYPERVDPGTAVRMSVRGLHVGERVGPIDLDVHRGEILGLGGLQGQGQREVLKALAGAIPKTAGRVLLDDQVYEPRTPAAAIKGGVTYVPEDRQVEGLFLQHSVLTNMTASSLNLFARSGLIDRSAEGSAALAASDTVGIDHSRLPFLVNALSGGNQQKVVLAKALMGDPRVILLHDCTRGVDIGTKADIFALMARLAREGCAVILYSSDLSELAHVCHRVVVMTEGRQRGVIQQEDLSEAHILRLSVGSAPSEGDPT